MEKFDTAKVGHRKLVDAIERYIDLISPDTEMLQIIHIPRMSSEVKFRDNCNKIGDTYYITITVEGEIRAQNFSKGERDAKCENVEKWVMRIYEALVQVEEQKLPTPVRFEEIEKEVEG